MNLTDFSIKQSNEFINAVSKKLADTDKRKKVTKIERLTIAGANGNTCDNFNTKVLFLKLKEDISTKGELLEFLDKAIKQADTDIGKLANTPFAILPIKAKNANL